MKQILPIIILVTLCSFAFCAEGEVDFTDQEMNAWKTRITEVDDPIGLGERLALIDYFQEELKQKVKPGTSIEDLRVRYWSIHAVEERRVALYNILVTEYEMKDLEKSVSYQVMLKKRATADRDREEKRLEAEKAEQAAAAGPAVNSKEAIEARRLKMRQELAEANKRMEEDRAKRRRELAEKKQREAEERRLTRERHAKEIGHEIDVKGFSSDVVERWKKTPAVLNDPAGADERTQICALLEKRYGKPVGKEVELADVRILYWRDVAIEKKRLDFYHMLVSKHKVANLKPTMSMDELQEAWRAEQAAQKAKKLAAHNKKHQVARTALFERLPKALLVEVKFSAALAYVSRDIVKDLPKQLCATLEEHLPGIPVINVNQYNEIMNDGEELLAGARLRVIVLGTTVSYGRGNDLSGMQDPMKTAVETLTLNVESFKGAALDIAYNASLTAKTDLPNKVNTMSVHSVIGTAADDLISKIAEEFAGNMPRWDIEEMKRVLADAPREQPNVLTAFISMNSKTVHAKKDAMGALHMLPMGGADLKSNVESMLLEKVGPVTVVQSRLGADIVIDVNMGIHYIQYGRKERGVMQSNNGSIPYRADCTVHIEGSNIYAGSLRGKYQLAAFHNPPEEVAMGGGLSQVAIMQAKALSDQLSKQLKLEQVLAEMYTGAVEGAKDQYILKLVPSDKKAFNNTAWVNEFIKHLPDALAHYMGDAELIVTPAEMKKGACAGVVEITLSGDKVSVMQSVENKKYFVYAEPLRITANVLSRYSGKKHKREGERTFEVALEAKRIIRLKDEERIKVVAQGLKKVADRVKE